MTLAKPLTSLGLGFLTWKTTEIHLLGDCSVNGQVIVPVHFLALDSGLLPWGGWKWQDSTGAQVDPLPWDSLSVGPELRTQRWLPQNRTAPLPLPHSVPCP